MPEVVKIMEVMPVPRCKMTARGKVAMKVHHVVIHNYFFLSCLSCCIVTKPVARPPRRCGRVFTGGTAGNPKWLKMRSAESAGYCWGRCRTPAGAILKLRR